MKFVLLLLKSLKEEYNIFFKKIILNVFLTAFLAFPNSYISSNHSATIENNDNIQLESDGLYDPKIKAISDASINNTTQYLKDNFSTRYFMNLTNNYGDNPKGSCGYVATAMLLSFWDTYWDDNVIEESYDKTTTLPGQKITESTESPGITKEPENISYVSDEAYHENIFKYKDTYFQFLLITIGDSLYGTAPHGYGMVYNKYIELYNYYIYDYKGYSQNEVEIIATDTDVRNQTIKLIKQGIPVKLGIGNHAVVAYDYDESTDNIYCHFGWGANTTHVTIESMGNNYGYHNLVAFNFKNKHIHSNNYHYINEYGDNAALCSHSTLLPSEIHVEGKYAIDVPPTFKWDSLIKEDWFKDINLYHELYILNSAGHDVVYKTKIFENKYRLAASEWKQAISIPGSKYSVYIRVNSDVDPYWDDFYYIQEFNEPYRYFEKTSLLPSDWGFEGRYYFSNELNEANLANDPTIKNTTITMNGLTIETDRLRCGYIENSYVILSPRRANAGRAYFEMNFDKAVYSFMYRACLWSYNEKLDGIAIIQTKDLEGNWTTLKDIPLNSLKSKEDGLTAFIENPILGIYGLRFEITSTATGSRNFGRFCLDDIVFSTKLGPRNNLYPSTDYTKTKAN